MTIAVSAQQMSKNIQRCEKFRNEYPSDAELEGRVTRTTATGLILLQAEQEPETPLKKIFKKLRQKWGWQFSESEKKTVLIWAIKAAGHSGAEAAPVEADQDTLAEANTAMLMADEHGYHDPSEAEQEYADSMGAIAFKQQAAKAVEQQALSDRDAAVHKALGVMG